MKTRLRLSMGLLALALISSSPSASAAGLVVGTINVRVVIDTSCSVTSSQTGTPVSYGTIDFGVRTNVDADVDATLDPNTTGSANGIGVQCSNGLPYTIALGPGLHWTGTGSPPSRQVATAVLLQTIPYRLFQNGRITPWGDGTALTNSEPVLSATGNGITQNYQIYGRLLATPTPAPGNYSDTVSVTIAW